MMGIKEWWHRRKVAGAVDDVRHWKFGFWFYNSVGILMILVALNALFQEKFIGTIAWGLIGGIIFLLGWNMYGKFRGKTEKARILLAAKRNNVNPQEVIAALKKVK